MLQKWARSSFVVNPPQRPQARTGGGLEHQHLFKHRRGPKPWEPDPKGSRSYLGGKLCLTQGFMASLVIVRILMDRVEARNQTLKTIRDGHRCG